MEKKPNVCHPPNIFDEIVKSKGAITLQKLFNQTAVTEITKVCLTLPDIRSGKDSLFTRLNRISQDRKNIKLFLQWLLSTKGYQFSISRFSNAN